MRNLEVAEAAFREAVALDPQLVDGWAMIARIRAATGDAAGARRALEDGLAVEPRAAGSGGDAAGVGRVRGKGLGLLGRIGAGMRLESGWKVACHFFTRG